MPERREDTSQEAVYRAGTKTDNKMTYVRTPEMVAKGICERSDIETFSKESKTHVKGLSGGISLFNQKNASRKWWYRVPAQKLPVGLVFHWRGPKDALPEPGTHYQIEPLVDMPLDYYVKLLGDVSVDKEPIAG